MCLGSILSVIFIGTDVGHALLIFQTSPLHVRIDGSLETVRPLLPPEGQCFQNIQNRRSGACGTVPGVRRRSRSTFQDGKLGPTEITFCSSPKIILRIVLTLILMQEEMAHICLWGNASDLSFSLQGDANVLQETHHRTDANKNILVVGVLDRHPANLAFYVLERFSFRVGFNFKINSGTDRYYSR